MKSNTLEQFWELYSKIPAPVKSAAKKCFLLWQKNPFHPSLHFKCIDTRERIWSLRITLGFRALGVMDNDEMTWFWIGNHKDYEKFF